MEKELWVADRNELKSPVTVKLFGFPKTVILAIFKILCFAIILSLNSGFSAASTFVDVSPCEYRKSSIFFRKRP